MIGGTISPQTPRTEIPHGTHFDCGIASVEILQSGSSTRENVREAWEILVDVATAADTMTRTLPLLLLPDVDPGLLYGPHIQVVP
jgi:hypothetical protein